MKIVTVVGVRPQFVKAGPVSRALQPAGWTEILIHTGQHYDRNLSAMFFEELGLPEPNYHLGIGSGSPSWQTAEMLRRLEEKLLTERPDWVLVYGDTTSTLAGALAAVKLHIPLAHVEAGLRSFNRTMPEEHNRVLTDHCADMLLCPTEQAMRWLAQEGLAERSHLVGDVMYDAVLQYADIAMRRSNILSDLNLRGRDYYLATLHRAYNTNEPGRLQKILRALAHADRKVILPMHPRTRVAMNAWDLTAPPNVQVIDPVSYLDMLVLEQKACLILTDSGGVQKEAYFFAVPCVTLRPETEWVETIAAGWNVLTDTDPDVVAHVLTSQTWPTTPPPLLFGDGRAAEKIVRLLSDGIATR